MASHTQYGRTLFIDDFKAGSSAKALTRISYTAKASEGAAYDEAWLQHLIMERPNLLPFHEIEPAFADVVHVCIELRTRSGCYVDNLLVTPAGDVALVECKLWRNPEARREVIGQIIEYAKEISTWTYEELQQAVSRTTRLGGPDAKPKQNLYEMVSVNGEIDEASFHDAVSRNLRRGRFLLLIVGDGIREEFEGMAEFLQQHAGLHFMLALVELALFEVPTGGYIAQPRILARTTNIDRGIVTVDNDGRVSIKPSSVAPTQGRQPVRMTITKELYLEKLERQFPGISISERLNGFIDKLTTYDVKPEFGTDSMILRWRPDDTRSWNMAQISSAGQVFTDNLGSQAYAAGLLEVQERYVKELAELVPGATARPSPKQTTWGAYKDDRTISVRDLLADEAHEEGWLHAIAEFQRAVTKALQGGPTQPTL